MFIPETVVSNLFSCPFQFPFIFKVNKGTWVCAGWLDVGLYFGRVTAVHENESIEARFVTHIKKNLYSENSRTEFFEANQIVDLPFKATYTSKGKWLIDFEGDVDLLFENWKENFGK